MTMNLKSFMFTTFLMSFAILSTSAGNYELSLKRKKIKPDLENIYVEKIIDARQNKICFGFVMDGYHDRNVPVVFDKGLELEFTNLFYESFEPREGKVPLAVKINHLFLYELKGEEGSFDAVEINMDFYMHEGNSWFHEFQAAKYLLNYGNTSSGKFENMLENLIEKCFNEYGHRMKNGWGYHRKVNEAEMNENGSGPYLNRIALSQQRTTSLYHTYNDFRDNIADTLTPFRVLDHRQFEGCKILREPYNNQKIKDVWGFHYHDTLFVNIANSYSPAIQTGDQLIIENPPILTDQSGAATGAMIGGLTFGLVGGLVGGLIGSATDGPEQSDLEYTVDFTTGLPVPLETPDYRIYKATLVFYTDKFKSDEHPIQLLAGGDQICIFPQESYLIMDVYPENIPVEICLKSDVDEYCENFEAEIFNTTYIELLIDKKGRVEIFPKQSGHTATSLQRLIEEGKLKRIEGNFSL